MRADVTEGGSWEIPARRSPAERSLRILFSLSHSGYLRHYAEPIRLLAQRGHRVHIALSRPEKEPGNDELADQLSVEYPGVTHAVEVVRGPNDGWRRLAWVVRGLIDLSRYADPRYADAVALRSRARRAVEKEVRRLNPVSRRVIEGLIHRVEAIPDGEKARRAVDRLGYVEQAIPPSRRVVKLLRSFGADVVVVSPLVETASSQVDYLKAAQRHGIPCGACIASWDNLTNKGLLRLVPDRVVVWNEIQRQELVAFHGIPSERIILTGAQKLDEWFDRRVSTNASDFKRKVGIDPGRPYVLYLCSSPFISPDEAIFVKRWVAGIRSSSQEIVRDVGVLIRPHPQNAAQWAETDLSEFENVAVYPRAGAQPDAGEPRADFFHSLAFGAAVIGINTTALIEAGILGKSVLTILDPCFAATQEGTLHFHYLRFENGGFLHEAHSLEEHLSQLARALQGTEDDREQTRRFITDFVRPHGLDVPAAPLVADAIEELGILSPSRSFPPVSILALRTLLYPIALATRCAASWHRAKDSAGRLLGGRGRCRDGRDLRPGQADIP